MQRLARVNLLGILGGFLLLCAAVLMLGCVGGGDCALFTLAQMLQRLRFAAVLALGGLLFIELSRELLPQNQGAARRPRRAPMRPNPPAAAGAPARRQRPDWPRVA